MRYSLCRAGGIKKGYITPAVSGSPKAWWNHSITLVVVGSREQGVPKRRLHNTCHLRSPKEGGIKKSYMIGALLGSLERGGNKKRYETPTISGYPARGQIKKGHILQSSRGQSKRNQKRLHNPWRPWVPQSREESRRVT